MKSPIRLRRSVSSREKKVFTGLTILWGVVGSFVLVGTLVTWDLFILLGASPYRYLGIGIATVLLTITCAVRLRGLPVEDSSKE